MSEDVASEEGLLLVTMDEISGSGVVDELGWLFEDAAPQPANNVNVKIVVKTIVILFIPYSFGRLKTA